MWESESSPDKSQGLKSSKLLKNIVMPYSAMCPGSLRGYSCVYLDKHVLMSEVTVRLEKIGMQGNVRHS